MSLIHHQHGRFSPAVCQDQVPSVPASLLIVKKIAVTMPSVLGLDMPIVDLLEKSELCV